MRNESKIYFSEWRSRGLVRCWCLALLFVDLQTCHCVPVIDLLPLEVSYKCGNKILTIRLLAAASVFQTLTKRRNTCAEKG